MRKALVAVVCGALLCLVGKPALAKPAQVDMEERAWFAGPHFRLDWNTQSKRFGGGFRIGRLSASVAVDPLSYARGVQHDTDLFAEWELSRGSWAFMGGYRLTGVPLLGRTYKQHTPLIGFTAPATSLLFGNVRVRFGAEFSLAVVKHGNDLPTVWFVDEAEVARASMNFGTFVRFEYGRGF